MDEKTFRKGIAGLQWEAKYLNNQHTSSEQPKTSFLTPINYLDPDLEYCIQQLQITPCDALDIGTGTGEQAFHLAQKGYNVTATDVSSTAIQKAKEQYSCSTLNLRFVEDNILHTQLEGCFKLIIDRGCLTLIPATLKEDYLTNVKRLLAKDGWLLIKADLKSESVIKDSILNTGLPITMQHAGFYENMNGASVKAVCFAIRNS